MGFRMRSDRAANEKLSDKSSSSSESSSDSSSDEAADLNPSGLQGVLGPGVVLGPAALKLQGSTRPASMAEPGRIAWAPAKDRFPSTETVDEGEMSRMRFRIIEEELRNAYRDEERE